jgi:hypothetical protein
VGAELFHPDGQTDRQADIMKLRVAFCNFANAPKNSLVFSISDNFNDHFTRTRTGVSARVSARISAMRVLKT